MNLFELCEKKYVEIHRITATQHVDPEWFYKAHGLSVVLPKDVIDLIKMDVDILDSSFPDRYAPVYVADSVLLKNGIAKRSIFLCHTIRDFKQESIFLGCLGTDFILFALSNETYSSPATHYNAEWSASIPNKDITQAVKNCFEYLVSIPCINNQFPRPNSNVRQPEIKPVTLKRRMPMHFIDFCKNNETRIMEITETITTELTHAYGPYTECFDETTFHPVERYQATYLYDVILPSGFVGIIENVMLHDTLIPRSILLTKISVNAVGTAVCLSIWNNNPVVFYLPLNQQRDHMGYYRATDIYPFMWHVSAQPADRCLKHLLSITKSITDAVQRIRLHSPYGYLPHPAGGFNDFMSPTMPGGGSPIYCREPWEYPVGVPTEQLQTPVPVKEPIATHGSVQVKLMHSLFVCAEDLVIAEDGLPIKVLRAFIENRNREIEKDFMATVYWDKSKMEGMFIGFGSRKELAKTQNRIRAYFLTWANEFDFRIDWIPIVVSKHEWETRKCNHVISKLDVRFAEAERITNEFTMVVTDELPDYLKKLLKAEKHHKTMSELYQITNR